MSSNRRFFGRYLLRSVSYQTVAVIAAWDPPLGHLTNLQRKGGGAGRAVPGLDRLSRDVHFITGLTYASGALYHRSAWEG